MSNDAKIMVCVMSDERGVKWIAWDMEGRKERQGRQQISESFLVGVIFRASHNTNHLHALQDW